MAAIDLASLTGGLVNSDVPVGRGCGGPEVADNEAHDALTYRAVVPGDCSGNNFPCNYNSGCATNEVCLSEYREATKAIIDAARRALWVPIQTHEGLGPAGCGFFDCKYLVGETRDTWLYQVAIDKALTEYGARVTASSVPTTVQAGTQFTISLTTNRTDAIAAAQSFVSLYLNGSGTPLNCTSPNCRFTTSGCGATSCTYTATVPGSITSGTSGTIVWHGFLTSVTNGPP